MPIVKRLLAIVLAVGVLAGSALLALNLYLAMPLESDAAFTIQIDEGASLSAVAQQLAGDGRLQWPALLALWGRFTGDAARIKAGEYEIEPGTTRRELLEQLVAGKVRLYDITLVEGWNFFDLRAAIRANTVLQSTLAFESAEQLAAELQLDYPHAEGLFFPETYRVARGTTDATLLRQAAALMQERLQRVWAERDADLPLQSPYELLTLASIVERETGLESERALIAGVFVRRLAKNMRLQTDPTVIYGMGERFNGNLTRSDLTTDTPYNTYTRGGLPPTPIALPGEAALRAAAMPADGDALFFVATGDGDGSHIFSTTLEQHNAAVAAYIARLRQINREQRMRDEN